jgi:hypothetical protein
MKYRLIAIAALTTPLCSFAAWAQNDPVTMAHVSSANQLGVLEYCQNQGDTDASAVTAEKAIIARLPAAPASSTSAIDAAEALGKTGTISMNGSSTSLSSMASTHNSSVSAMCQQMASTVKQTSAAFQQNGGMVQMPAMPSGGGMPTMPSMPSGGSMPTMPSVPGAPAQ